MSIWREFIYNRKVGMNRLAWGRESAAGRGSFETGLVARVGGTEAVEFISSFLNKRKSAFFLVGTGGASTGGDNVGETFNMDLGNFSCKAGTN